MAGRMGLGRVMPCTQIEKILHVVSLHRLGISRVGQNRIYTPYVTVYLVISLPKIPCIHRIYMVLANLRY